MTIGMKESFVLSNRPSNIFSQSRLLRLSRMPTGNVVAKRPQNEGAPEIQLFECADRELEIRSIAKEIKRLVLTNDYNLSDVALVVRAREYYADTIARVFADESVP